MRVITVFFAFLRAYLFYPAMVSLFLVLYFNDAHWIFGLSVIIAILAFDPIWRVMASSLFKKRGK